MIGIRSRGAMLSEKGQLCAVRLLGEDLVLWRAGGQAVAWQDLCVHRGTRLSLGKVEDGLLVCPYHGWRYDGNGRCVADPRAPGTDTANEGQDSSSIGPRSATV